MITSKTLSPAEPISASLEVTPPQGKARREAAVLRGAPRAFKTRSTWLFAQGPWPPFPETVQLKNGNSQHCKSCPV